MNSSHNITEFRTGDDGSKTLFSKDFHQCFHNPKGALSESEYVYLHATGLTDLIKHQNEITILEVGFGTGLNLWLTIREIEKINPDCTLHFYTIEAFPLSVDQVLECNHQEFIPSLPLNNWISEIYGNLSEKGNHSFNLLHHTVTIHYNLFSQVDLENVQAEIIYFDAFSPEQNPDLWSPDVFTKLKKHCTKIGVLTSYCAATKARAAMIAGGWHVVKFPGVLGKREITLASKTLDSLQKPKMKLLNEKRIKERIARGDFSF